MAALEPCFITCPPERHIPVEFQEIYSIVKTNLNVAQRQRFEELAQLVESLYSQEFMALRRNLKHNFQAFSVGAKGQQLPTRVGRGLPTQADLDMRENRLVSDILQLMAAARYNILTRAEWDLAKSDKFMFALPVAVNWAYYDGKLLPTFWGSAPERQRLRMALPDLADRVLVFHRGISVAEASGLYTKEKIDLLVDYLITGPALTLWRMMLRKKAPLARPQSLNLTESTHKNKKVIERRTLRRLMPTVLSLIKNFFTTLKLQEPAFKEVVVVYRSAYPTRVHNKLPAIQRSKDSRLKDILSGRNVHIKCFHDIPMADIDVIFADKKVYLKTLTLIQLGITIVGAMVAALTVLFRSEGKVDMNVLWSSLSLVGARCASVYSSAQAERSRTIQDMVNILYDKTSDAQEGVLSMLLEDMAEQQLKEAVLAYTLLFLREAEMSEGMLDDLCESFMSKNFDIKIDFAVEDALPRLVEWGLVKPVKNGRFLAVPVEEAAHILEQRWAHSYEALSKPPLNKIYALHTLLGDGHELPELTHSMKRANSAAAKKGVDYSTGYNPAAIAQTALGEDSSSTKDDQSSQMAPGKVAVVDNRRGDIQTIPESSLSKHKKKFFGMFTRNKALRERQE